MGCQLTVSLYQEGVSTNVDNNLFQVDPGRGGVVLCVPHF